MCKRNAFIDCFIQKELSEFYSILQERICEDSTSFDLTSHDLASAIGDLQELGLRLVDLVGQEETMDTPIGEGYSVGREN